MMCIIIAQAGCAPTVSQFFVKDYRAGGESKAYTETFDEAYYRKLADGNVEIMLRRTARGIDHPAETITQVIHLRSLWRSIPGTTVAESSQINAAVCYMIEVGGSAATFEGTGSLFFNESKNGQTITGSLDYALLKPTRRIGHGPDVFTRAELRGTFTAHNDPRRTIRGINQIARTFAQSADTNGRR